MAEQEKLNKRARGKKTTPATSLLEALKFLKPVHKKTGSVKEQHCIFGNHWAVASNDVLTIATKIEEDLNACPQIAPLEESLKKVADDLSITQLDSTTLSVNSGDLNAAIPCTSFENMNIAPPDPNIAVIDDRIRDAMTILNPLVDDKSPAPLCAAMLLKANSAVATNKRSLIEYWHGINLPNMMIPKQTVKAILRTKKKLVGFGYSGHSATFHFDDESFIRTLLFEYTDYIGYESFFKSVEPWTLNKDFFKAVKILDKLSKHAIIHFADGKIQSDNVEDHNSTYEIEGLPEGMKFHSTYLILIEKACEKVYFDTEENTLYFFGDNCRGVLKGISDND